MKEGITKAGDTKGLMSGWIWLLHLYSQQDLAAVSYKQLLAGGTRELNAKFWVRKEMANAM